MRILVCGAGGMLGHAVVEVAAAAGHDVIGLDSSQLDVTDAAAVRERIAQAPPWRGTGSPDTVVNCAAWTDVDGAEEHEPRALEVNGEGAGHVAAAAAEAGASVVYISTDYVFDGERPEGYVESDEPAPLSAYGRTKLAGERSTQDANPRCFVVRSSWMFGAHGRNFVDSMLRLAADRGELRVVDDQVGCPTWTRHLAEAIVPLSGSEDYGLHHLAGAGHTSWYGFTREIVRRAGIDCSVEPCTSEEFPRPARRPAYSILRGTRGRSLPPWQQGLAKYLEQREELAA